MKIQGINRNILTPKIIHLSRTSENHIYEEFPTSSFAVTLAPSTGSATPTEFQKTGCSLERDIIWSEAEPR